jgi:hypothetical protein
MSILGLNSSILTLISSILALIPRILGVISVITGVSDDRVPACRVAGGEARREFHP